MSLSVKDVTSLIRALLAREWPDLTLLGVVPTEGDGRASARGVEEDVRSALFEALERHTANG
jgi:hypothetical protein